MQKRTYQDGVRDGVSRIISLIVRGGDLDEALEYQDIVDDWACRLGPFRSERPESAPKPPPKKKVA